MRNVCIHSYFQSHCCCSMELLWTDYLFKVAQTPGYFLENYKNICLFVISCYSIMYVFSLVLIPLRDLYHKFGYCLRE